MSKNVKFTSSSNVESTVVISQIESITAISKIKCHVRTKGGFSYEISEAAEVARKAFLMDDAMTINEIIKHNEKDSEK